MLPRIAAIFSVLTLMFIPGAAAPPVQIDDDPTKIDWARDRTCQLVFHAVLEGLYSDGVSNDIVDRILDVDPATKQMRFDTHFVYCCPLCHPAYEAFILYRNRGHFYGRKDALDTFGPGLEPSLRRQLLSPDVKVRLEALHKVIQRWVTLRLDSMRLSGVEKTEWAERLAIRRKAGMMHLEKSRFGGKEAGFKGCAICDGSADACPLKP
jgi:hypothetical protein